MNPNASLPSGASLVDAAKLGPVLVLNTPAGSARIALHGATVLSYVPAVGPGAGRDLFWVSPDTVAASGKAIRGGVPLCGPWFGPLAQVPQAPAHGLMRTRAWTLERVERVHSESGEGLRASLTLALPADTSNGWGHDAAAQLEVMLGDTLQIELTVRNVGSTPFLLSGALHTYFAVSDVRQVSVEGLAGQEFIDFTHGGVRRRAGLEPLRLDREAAEFYLTGAPVVLMDPVWQRRIRLRGWGAGATVVWNPWEQTAAGMGDVGSHWPHFICVENANVPHTAVALSPHQSQHMGVEFSLTP